jgi:hypothetical protein
MFKRPLSAMTHVQVHDSLRAELIGWPTGQVSAFAIGEHPLVEVGVVHNVNMLSFVYFAHIIASVVQRNPATLIDSPQGHDARQVLGHTRPLPQRRLRFPIIGPTGMRQAREDLETSATFLVGIDLAMQEVHSLQAGLQFRGRPTSPRLAPSVGCPLGTLDDPVFLRAPRVVPVHPDTEADQPQRQLGGEVSPRPPGKAVVDSEAAGQPPANKSQADLLSHGLGGDLRPSPEGEKPRSTAPRRCIRRSFEANLLLHNFV